MTPRCKLHGHRQDPAFRVHQIDPRHALLKRRAMGLVRTPPVMYTHRPSSSSAEDYKSHFAILSTSPVGWPNEFGARSVGSS